MEKIREFEDLIETVLICLTIVITTGLIVYGGIKHQQHNLCNSIHTDQIRAQCVKDTR